MDVFLGKAVGIGLTLVATAGIAKAEDFEARKQAAADSLKACAYGIAVRSYLPFEAAPAEFNRGVPKICAQHFATYASYADEQWYNRQEKCGETFCLSLDDDGDGPDKAYAMIVVDLIVKDYQKAYSNLVR